MNEVLLVEIAGFLKRVFVDGLMSVERARREANALLTKISEALSEGRDHAD